MRNTRTMCLKSTVPGKHRGNHQVNNFKLLILNVKGLFRTCRKKTCYKNYVITAVSKMCIDLCPYLSRSIKIALIITADQIPSFSCLKFMFDSFINK